MAEALVIAISTSTDASHNASTSNLDSYFPLRNECRRRSPAPSPHSSPRVQDTLELPPQTIRRVSDASSITLNGGDSPQGVVGANRETVYGGPLTAEPEGIVIEPSPMPGVTKLPRNFCLGRAPMMFINDRRNRAFMIKDFKELDLLTKVPAMLNIPPRAKPGKWEPLVHPEGPRYFRYENFYTHADLFDPVNLAYAEKFVEQIRDQVFASPDFPANVEVGFDMYVDEDDDQMGAYYCVNMDTKEVFWPVEVDVNFYIDSTDVKFINSREHIHLIAEASYWFHVWMFPHDRPLSEEDLHRLQSEIRWSCFDHETSPTSCAAYSIEECHRFLQLIKDIPMQAHGMCLPGNMAIVARLQYHLLTSAFNYYRGERCARIDSNRSVLDKPKPKNSWWFTILNWLCFFTPSRYLDRLREVFVDGWVHYTAWRRFTSELNNDWTNSDTPTMVLLAANVSFLAIQSVDLGGSPGPNRTFGQIISYISTLVAIGNTIACMQLKAQHRASMHQWSHDAAQYLLVRANTAQRMERLAVTFSIPNAFFTWSLLTFCTAITWVCFHESSLWTRVFCAVTLVVITAFVVVIVLNGEWKTRQQTQLITERMQSAKKMVVKMPGRVASRMKSMSVGVKTRLNSLAPRVSYPPWKKNTLPLEYSVPCGSASGETFSRDADEKV